MDGLPKTQRITIRTVAADAGVSVAAVSKVLRNAYGVSDALRARVQASIDRLGYRPTVAARGMRGSTFTLGLLVADLVNPYLSAVIEGINAVAETAGYKVLIGVGQSRMPIETRMIDSMIDHGMDGLILIAPRAGPETLPRYAAQIPIVAVGHHESGQSGFDTVNADDFAGAQMAVRALTAAGHDDIGMISLTLNLDHRTNVSDIREDGYRAAMAEAGLADRIRIVRMSLDHPQMEDQLNVWLTAPGRPRAVFCWSDLHAVPLRNMAAQMGLRVPGDLAIVGYDNSPVAALPLIGLTTVDQDGFSQGQEAARLVLERIGGRGEAVHLLLPPWLVRRASA
jgi:LacI family transcriptional regulator